MMNAVGGTSLHYWAQSWRLNPWDFKVVSETTKRYGASRIPKGSTVEDWPFGLDELEPYYDRVEHEIGVSGQAGNIRGTIDRRGNIFEGPRSRAFPMPPLRGTGFTDMMASAATSLGWHPFPGPAAINSRTYDGRSACMYHGFCNKGGCHVDAKNSPVVTTIPKAQKTGHLKVVTRAHVTTIEVDSDGRVTGVNYVTDGVEYFQPAKVVLLATYTYENTRTLLLSKSRGVSERPVEQSRTGRPSLLQPQPGRGRHGAVSDESEQLVRPAGAGHRRRRLGRRQLRSRGPRLHRRRQPVGLFGSPADRRREHGHVREGARRGARRGRSSSRRTPIARTPPTCRRRRCRTRTTISIWIPTVKDPLGFPVCRITADYKDNERKLARSFRTRWRSGTAPRAPIEIQRGPIGVMGVTRTPTAARAWATTLKRTSSNRWGFSHEVPNLGILGASVMGTSGARNPTLTAQALAWRTAEHLVKNWKTIAG